MKKALRRHHPSPVLTPPPARRAPRPPVPPEKPRARGRQRARPHLPGPHLEPGVWPKDRKSACQRRIQRPAPVRPPFPPTVAALQAMASPRRTRGAEAFHPAPLQQSRIVPRRASLPASRPPQRAQPEGLYRAQILRTAASSRPAAGAAPAMRTAPRQQSRMVPGQAPPPVSRPPQPAQPEVLYRAQILRSVASPRPAAGTATAIRKASRQQNRTVPRRAAPTASRPPQRARLQGLYRAPPPRTAASPQRATRAAQAMRRLFRPASCRQKPERPRGLNGR